MILFFNQLIAFIFLLILSYALFKFQIIVIKLLDATYSILLSVIDKPKHISFIVVYSIYYMLYYALLLELDYLLLYLNKLLIQDIDFSKKSSILLIYSLCYRS